MVIQARFGSAQTGLGYQFYSAAGTLLGSRITAGIVSLPETGSYAANATVPADAVGVFWNSSTSEATEDLRTAAKLDAADQILLVSPYVPAENPASIVPAPPDDLNDGNIYLDSQDFDNTIVAGVKVEITPVGVGPFVTSAGRFISKEKKTYLTDSTGRMLASMERTDRLSPATLKYKVVCTRYGISKLTTLTSANLNIKDIP